jgi:signal transduction histidine kinase
MTAVGDYRNWVREVVVFLFIMLAMTMIIRMVVRRVDRAFDDQRAAAEERAAQQAEIAEAYDLLARLHRSLETAKEAERRHLARELHDEMGQSLTALKLRLKMAAAAAGGGGAAIGDALGVVDALLVRVRKLSIDLSPPLLDEAGLVPAVRAHLESHAQLASVEVVLDASGLEVRLPAELETAAFRVIQESVTNVARHAGARHIAVTLACDAGRLAISVRDDGVGFAVDATLAGAARGGHLGVAGMRERIKGLGGSLEVTSAPGVGTEVSAVIPVATP